MDAIHVYVEDGGDMAKLGVTFPLR